MRSLDSIRFDAPGFTLAGEEDGTLRVWEDSQGDVINLRYFALPPDIEADIRSIDDVRSFSRQNATKNGVAIIEVETPTIDGCLAIRKIIKIPQKPTGMTYVGSFTFPFRDFSYVVLIQCPELGMTGMRDTMVFSDFLANGSATIDPSQPMAIGGWMRDPYDPSIKDVFAMNRSETEEYDARFPDHPLSRLRRLLRSVQPSLRIADEVKREAAFTYPARPRP